MRARTMRHFRPLPVLLVLTACGGGSPNPTGPSSSVVSYRHLARDGNDRGQPRRSGSSGADEWADHLDIRGRSTDQPADLPDDRSVAAYVAAGDDHREHGVDTGQYSSRADQHTRPVRLPARVPRHVRERGHRERFAY